MPTKADAPLRKVTLNLYDLDVRKMELRYGHGWSEVVRSWVNQHLREYNPIQLQQEPYLEEDFEE